MPKQKNSPTKEETQEQEKQEEVKATVKAINSIKVLALWKAFSPDCRPYKPSTPAIEFPEPLIIAVDVPLEPDLIKNASVISMAQLSNQQEPKAHFTPLGMRYIIDQFESAMKNGEQDAELQVPASDDEDWGDDEPAKETKKPAADDEWEDDDKSDKADEDKPWDEEW